MNVDYAPSGYWSAYRDSQPVSVKMDLNFTELRPLYQQDHEETPEDNGRLLIMTYSGSPNSYFRQLPDLDYPSLLMIEHLRTIIKL